ncbi:putative reverse transcriptase domain-containing protein [Tanacetum coccineum]
MKCPQHYLTEMQEVILFYNGLEVPTRQILDSKGAIPTKTAADAKVAIQEMAEYSKKWHNGTSRGRTTEMSDGLAAIQAQLNNLRREIKKVNEKVYAAQERGFGSLPSSTEPNPRDHVKSILTTVEADTHLIRQAYEALHIDKTIPRKEKEPGSFTLPCFINSVCFDNTIADLGASVSVMPLSTYLNLGLGELAHTKLTVELADRIVKYPKGIAENVLVGIAKFVFPVDFIILDMPEDINVSLIFRRPFLSTAYAKIDVFKRKITLRIVVEKIIFKSVKPASSLIKRVYVLSLRERMEYDLEARLMGETLVQNQVDDLMPTIEEGEVFDAPMDDLVEPRDDELDIGIDDYPILEDMDAYRDKGMGDVIVGEPFLKDVGIKARWFEGMITLYKGNKSVTYQMVWSHPRFKSHTNVQCNKILSLMKVSKHDKMNGISHSYQKLKEFYKGVLNSGSNFIRDPKMEEWLTHGHVSVHEMEW